jgi:hypothetical protein
MGGDGRRPARAERWTGKSFGQAPGAPGTQRGWHLVGAHGVCPPVDATG